VVLAGGAVGTPARYALSTAFPTRTGGWPTGTFLANLVGAFLLGVLLEGLARRGDDSGRRRVLRLGLGTGFLGAFTTYSALAVETDLLVRASRPGLALTYALLTVGGGLLLSTAGIAAAAYRRPAP
jgi:CrcB protein